MEIDADSVLRSSPSVMFGGISGSREFHGNPTAFVLTGFVSLGAAIVMCLPAAAPIAAAIIRRMSRVIQASAGIGFCRRRHPPGATAVGPTTW